MREELIITSPSLAGHDVEQMRRAFPLISRGCYKGIVRDAVAHRIGMALHLGACCVHEKISMGNLCPTKLPWDFSSDTRKSSKPEEKLEFQSIKYWVHFLSSPASCTLACSAINFKRVPNYLDPLETWCEEQNKSRHMYCLVASYWMKYSHEVNVAVNQFHSNKTLFKKIP